MLILLIEPVGFTTVGIRYFAPSQISANVGSVGIFAFFMKRIEVNECPCAGGILCLPGEDALIDDQSQKTKPEIETLNLISFLVTCSEFRKQAVVRQVERAFRD